MMEHFPSNAIGRDRLEKRYKNATLWDAFLKFAAAKGGNIPVACLSRDVTQAVAPSEELQAALVEIYKEVPEI